MGGEERNRININRFYLAVISASIVLAVFTRAIVLCPAPLWFDELFTAVIAGQPNFHDFVHMARADAQASFLYYLMMHVWQAFFGLSDVALRIPEAIFSALAPVVIVFVRVPGLTRTDRLCWAALLALWIPGIGFAGDARVYAPLLFAATVQTLVFRKLLAAPSLRQAALWVVSADLSIAIHYDAAYLALAQGLIFLWVNKRAAIATWPAALLTAPVFVDILWKWPILSRIERIGTAWYSLLHPVDLIPIAFYLVGGIGWEVMVWIVVLPVLAVGLWMAWRRRGAPGAAAVSPDLLWAAGAAIFGVATMVSVGFVRPSFARRYLTPFEPGVLLGLVLGVRFLAGQFRQVFYLGLTATAVVTLGLWLHDGARHPDSAVPSWSTKFPSDNLMANDVHKAVFFIDSSVAPEWPPGLVADIGKFYFRQARYRIEITPLQLDPANDPVSALLDAAEAADAAIIWLYSPNSPTFRRTPAMDYIARISRIDPRYACEDFGQGVSGNIACRRLPP